MHDGLQLQLPVAGVAGDQPASCTSPWPHWASIWPQHCAVLYMAPCGAPPGGTVHAAHSQWRSRAVRRWAWQPCTLVLSSPGSGDQTGIGQVSAPHTLSGFPHRPASNYFSSSPQRPFGGLSSGVAVKQGCGRIVTLSRHKPSWPGRDCTPLVHGRRLPFVRRHRPQFCAVWAWRWGRRPAASCCNHLPTTPNALPFPAPVSAWVPSAGC